MKELLKIILKKFHLYHPLQSSYRNFLFLKRRAQTRRVYASLRGEGFICNVCSRQYKEFVPDYPTRENREALHNYQVIAGYGDHIFCPYCLSTARERLVIAELSEIQETGMKILHLSPEKNVYHFLKQKGRVTTADILPGFYRTIDGLIEKQDATHFTYPDNHFDLLVANHILEHISDDIKALNEMFRVLKTGARAVLQVPYSELIEATLEEPTINNATKQSALFGQKDHVRIYSLTDYVMRVRTAGFNVEVIPYRALQKYYKYAIQYGESFLIIKKLAT